MLGSRFLTVYLDKLTRWCIYIWTHLNDIADFACLPSADDLAACANVTKSHPFPTPEWFFDLVTCLPYEPLRYTCTNILRCIVYDSFTEHVCTLHKTYWAIPWSFPYMLLTGDIGDNFFLALIAYAVVSVMVALMLKATLIGYDDQIPTRKDTPTE